MKRQAQIVPLASEVSFLSGGTPRMSESRFWGGDIPWVSSGEMTESRISFTERRVTEEGARNSTKIVPANTVLVVVRGMSLAKEFRISISEREVTFNQDIKALKPSKKIDPWFLYYYLKSQRHAIRDSATDASHGTKKLETHVLEHWPLPLLDIPTQRAIASILSAYDDLIANNRRRIQLMEQAARLLYKEWFVHLRFPGHEHTKIHNGIPEGWEKKRIDERFETVLGGTPARNNPEFWGGEIPWINSGEVNNTRILKPTERITEKGLCKSAATLMPAGTTVLAITGATLGQVSRLEIECSANQSVVGVFDSADPKNEWLYLFFSHEIKKIINHATGGAQQHINKEVVNATEFLEPSKAVLEVFRQIVRPVFGQIKCLELQKLSLIKARDLLLPRLMNGEVAV